MTAPLAYVTRRDSASRKAAAGCASSESISRQTAASSSSTLVSGSASFSSLIYSRPSLLLKRWKSSRGRICQVRARTKCKRSRDWQPTVTMSSRIPMMQPSRPASTPSTSSTSTTSCPTFTFGGICGSQWRPHVRSLFQLDGACAPAGRK
jgi:hypothetical protein